MNNSRVQKILDFFCRIVSHPWFFVSYSIISIIVIAIGIIGYIITNPDVNFIIFILSIILLALAIFSLIHDTQTVNIFIHPASIQWLDKNGYLIASDLECKKPRDIEIIFSKSSVLKIAIESFKIDYPSEGELKWKKTSYVQELRQSDRSQTKIIHSGELISLHRELKKTTTIVCELRINDPDYFSKTGDKFEVFINYTITILGFDLHMSRQKESSIGIQI